MDITAVRQAIATQVNTVIGPPLTALWYVPDMATEPMLWVKPDTIDYDRAMRRLGKQGSGLETINLEIVLVVSRADDLSAQQNLDQYIKAVGPLSIKQAVESGRAQYGGTAYTGVLDDLWVQRVEAYRYYLLGDTRFLGAGWAVTVIGQGDTS